MSAPSRLLLSLFVTIASLCISAPLAARAAAPTSAAKVWATDALHKIRPSATVPSGASTTVNLSAARNEFESFQIVITGAASRVSVSVTSPLRHTTKTGPSGEALTIDEVRLYREGIITLKRRSSADPESDAGAWPDALIPDVDEIDHQKRNAFPFDVRSGTSQAVWVDVFVPSGATAGTYQGTLEVAFGATRKYVDVNLTVWDFELPATATARSAYALAWGSIPAGFGLPDSSDINAIAPIRYKFGVMALDHRVSLSHFDDGDWYGTEHFLQWYGSLMDDAKYVPPVAARPRLRGAHLTSLEYMGPPPATASSEHPDDDAYWTQKWSTMCASNGWSDRLFQYTADEPSQWNNRWADVGPRATTAHAVTPPVRTLVTTQLDAANAQTVTYANATGSGPVAASSVIDVMVPAINFMATGQRDATDWSGLFPSYDTFVGFDSLQSPTFQPSPANELWLYQSCMSHDCGGTSTEGSGWPSYMIDASAVRNRAMQWLMFSNRTTGELYYEAGYALYAKRDAWTDQWAFTGNGDGTLFYPGTPAKIGGPQGIATNIPVASIRLKEIRDGMEDFEYLTLVKAFDPAEAMYVAKAVFPNAHATGVNPSNVTSHREYLACLIQRHALGDGRTCNRPAVLP